MQSIHRSLIALAACGSLLGACSSDKLSGADNIANGAINGGGSGASGPTGGADASVPPAAASASGTAAGVGSGTTAQVASGTGATATLPPGSNVVIPKDCGSDGATQANLISKTLENGAPGNFIDYQVFLTDCTGAYKAFTADTIAFDVNGVLSNFGADISFQAGDGVSTPVTGPMLNIRGSDLFNHTGPGWAHWATNKPVSFPSTQKFLTFRLLLDGATVSPLGGGVQLSTYLKFGKAAAVAIPVTLVK